MLKKSLLIGSAVLLASTPLLVAQEKRDIFTFGSDSVTGGQSVTNFNQSAGAYTSWAGTNTGANVSILNHTQQGSTLRPFFSGSSGWTNQDALKSLQESTGLNNNDFSGLTNGIFYSSFPGGGRGPELTFTGFDAGQEYLVSLIIKTGSDVNVPNLCLVNSRKHELTGFECYYGLLSGNNWENGALSTTIEFTTKNQEYLVSYRFTANEGASLGMWFTSAGTGAPAMDIGMIAISTIPEPSAFGLLAGLGAIALTVSRRRRK